MRRHSKLLLSALTAALMLAVAVSSASAAHLSTTSQTFRQVWTPLTFASGEGGGGITIRCSVTLEGSFHSATIPKNIGLLIGYVTRAEVGHPCTGGEAWSHNGVEKPSNLPVFANSLPWHVTYEGFEGALPNIAGIRLLLRAFFTLNTSLSGLCEYNANAQGVAKREASGGITGIVPDNTFGLAKTAGGIFCPNPGFFSEPEGGRATVLGTTTRITVTLI